MLISLHTEKSKIKGENTGWFVSARTVREETESHTNSGFLRFSLVLGMYVILYHLGQPECRAANHRKDGTNFITTKTDLGLSLGTSNVGVFFFHEVVKLYSPNYVLDFTCL